MSNDSDHALNRSELRQLEVRVDAARASIPVPSWTLPHARYALLAVSDDLFRLRMLQVKAGELDLEQLTLWLDKSKYMLKYALEHARHLPDTVLRVRPPLFEETWGLAKDLLLAHIHWDSAVAAFTSAYEGGTRCIRVGENRYAFRNTMAFERQANDHLESNTVAVSSPDALVYKYLYAPDAELPKALRDCCERMRRQQDKRPRISDAVLDEIDSLFGERRRVLPEGWTSPFGSGRELARSFRNLWGVAIAHILAVTNARTGQTGMNVDALLGEHDAPWLARALSRNGGVAMESARALLELLTYGKRVDSPDPALQFFFAIRPGLLGVPWGMYLTCNAERNLLTLMARTHPSDFHTASGAFETAMTQELRDVLTERTWRAIFNRTLPNESAAGEVDAILIDPASHTVLVVELRWFLEPSESREVAKRQKAGREKAEKAKKKRAAVERRLAQLLAEANVSGEAEWTVDTVAVFDNYLPTPEGTADVPFISHRAFLSGVLRFESLAELVAWIRDGRWLPVAGRHFLQTRVPAEFDGIHIEVDGLNLTDDGLAFVMERDRALLARWGLVPTTWRFAEPGG